MEKNKMMDDFIKLYQAQCYKELIEKIELTENYYLSSKLLVMKGCCIQLLNDDHTMKNYPIEASIQCFEQAINLDPHNIEGYIELGYVYLNVLDEPLRAISIFEKGLSILNHNGDTLTQLILKITMDIKE